MRECGNVRRNGWKTGVRGGRLLEQLSPDPGNIENIARTQERSLRTLTGPTHDTVTRWTTRSERPVNITKGGLGEVASTIDGRALAESYYLRPRGLWEPGFANVLQTESYHIDEIGDEKIGRLTSAKLDRR